MVSSDSMGEINSNYCNSECTMDIQHNNVYAEIKDNTQVSILTTLSNFIKWVSDTLHTLFIIISQMISSNKEVVEYTSNDNIK